MSPSVVKDELNAMASLSAAEREIELIEAVRREQLEAQLVATEEG